MRESGLPGEQVNFCKHLMRIDLNVHPRGVVVKYTCRQGPNCFIKMIAHLPEAEASYTMTSNLLQAGWRPLRWAGLLVLLTLPSFFTACSRSSPSTSPARATAQQVVQVTVAPAQQQDLPIYLTGLGSIEAYYTVSVKSRVDGQLIDVKF